MTKENSQITEIQKFEIEKKHELQKQKFEAAAMVKVGNESLASISMLAEKFSKAGALIPPDFQNQPEKCFVAIYKGASLGLDAFTSVQRISVVNGRATIWGDTALALVRRSGLLAKFEEVLVENNGKLLARCTVQRKGENEHISEFSQDDAIKAGIWDKNVWKTYPKRMIKYRARAYALRDIFPDVIDGLYLKEEMEGGEDFNKESKDMRDVTQQANDHPWNKLKGLAWGKDDIKNDFGDVAPRENPAAPVIKDYEQLLDALTLCDTKESLQLFEQECQSDIAHMKKNNPVDHKKFMAMIEAYRGEFQSNS